jgi:hypothetical protein
MVAPVHRFLSPNFLEQSSEHDWRIYRYASFLGQHSQHQLLSNTQIVVDLPLLLPALPTLVLPARRQ